MSEQDELVKRLGWFGEDRIAELIESQQQRIHELEQQLAARDAVIAKVGEALSRPLDPLKVLDTPPGRALWKAVLADDARAILAAAPESVLAEHDAETKFTTADPLRDHLDSLNYDRGIDTGVILVNGGAWLAYATDPDGAWYFESGDPWERMVEDEHGDLRYQPVGWDFLGPQIDAHGATVLWPERSRS